MEEISNKMKLLLIGISLIPIAIVIFFGSLIIVNAEGNFIAPANFTFKNYPSNIIYNASNCGYDRCEFMNINDRSRGGVFRNYNVTHSFTGVNSVIFNGSITEPTYTGISSINFLGNPCYYTQNLYLSSDQYTEGNYFNSFSAICPISNTDNIGTLTIQPNQELIEIVQNAGVMVQGYTISKIKIVSDSWGSELLRLLYQNNGYWATNEGILLQVKSILNTQLVNDDVIKGYLNTIQGYLQQQKDQAHQDAQAQKQQDQENHDELMNEDIDNQDKEQVDETEYNDYKQKEDELMDIAEEADLTGLQIGIDRGTSSKIWQLITRIIQSNAKVFSLFISILSIGIIKIALAR